MIHRRLETIDLGYGRGLLEGLSTLLASRAGTGSLEEIREGLDRFADFAGYKREPFQQGVLSSRHLNREFEQIYLTLSALYRFLADLEKLQSTHQALADSDLSGLEQGVLKLLEDIRNFRILKLNPDWNDVKVISFRDGRNLSPSALRAVVDTHSQELIQKPILKSRILERAGSLRPSMEIEVLSDGLSGVGRKDHGPENAIDPSPETFWAEVLFAERPVFTTYDSELYEGVIVQATVDLKQLELLNTFEIKPFGLYPIRILNLETSTDGETFSPLSDFEEPSASLSWSNFRTDPVAARFVRLTLLQESFRGQEFLVPKKSIENHRLLDLLAEEDLRLFSDTRVDSEFETRLADFDQGARTLLDGLQPLEAGLGTTVLPAAELGPAERLKLLLSPSLGSPSGSALSLLKREETAPQELSSIFKIEYVLGLQHFEIGFTEYEPRSVYESPAFALTNTLFELALEAEETHATLLDGSTEIPASTVRYDVELAPYRSAPIVPLGTGEIFEVVTVDPATRTGFVRFATSTSNPPVFRNGTRLESGDYTFTPGDRKLEISNNAFLNRSHYLIRYVPTEGQDRLDVRELFTSLPIPRPEVFSGTDPAGRVRLSAAPFVNYEVVYDRELFYQPSSEARFYYRRELAQTLLDGEVFGTAETALDGDITASATVIPVDSVLSFYSPTSSDLPGTFRIEDEIITYTSVSGGAFQGCVRGTSGTVAVAHTNQTRVVSTGRMVYEPLEVVVDGIRARNLTDYVRGEHPAFQEEDSALRVRSYIQAGANLYFAAPIKGATIEVRFRVLARYVKVRATLESTAPHQHSHTAAVSEVRILLSTAEA